MNARTAEAKNMWGKATLLTVLSAALLLACATTRGGYAPPREHPEELKRGRPSCTAADCHQGAKGPLAFGQLDHTPSFAAEGHRGAAKQSQRVCEMCHRPSFCSDCHATRSELKPPVRTPDASYRAMPHRGDYLSRHRIDARIDPASCFRCHGSPKSSGICVKCHGK